MEALKSKITKNKNGEIVSHLEITEVVLAILVNNDYQYDWRILHTFVPNKSFSQLLDITTKLFSPFQYVHEMQYNQNMNIHIYFF